MIQIEPSLYYMLFRDLIEDEDIRNSTIAFPTDEMLENCETFLYLGDEVDNIYNDYWNKVKSS